ncbi:MAG: hypothetical protein IRY94_12570 [Rhodospirillaceae bacterium]|nr:hypothetical protein [Rhodospirillaceae bacterium]
MGLSTYDELKDAIGAWLARPGDATLTPFVPAFIALAEARLNRRLRLRAMEARATLTLTGPLTALPADFLEVVSLRLAGGSRETLGYAPPVVLDAIDSRTPAGRPRVYTLTGDSLRVAPAPGAPCVAELAYLRRLPPLSAQQPTNWLLAAAPDLYLYGALLEAAPFLMDDERARLWQAAFETAVQALVEADARDRTGAAAPAAVVA